MKYTLIDEDGPYALILQGEGLTQYAVVRGLDKKTGDWDWTCCYYDFGKFSEPTRAEALLNALDYYLMRTNEKHISWAGMSEIATILKDGLIEDDEEDACRYMADVAELSDTEAECFGLDMEQYRAATDEDGDNHPALSSTGFMRYSIGRGYRNGTHVLRVRSHVSSLAHHGAYLKSEGGF